MFEDAINPIPSIPMVIAGGIEVSPSTKTRSKAADMLIMIPV